MKKFVFAALLCAGFAAASAQTDRIVKPRDSASIGMRRPMDGPSKAQNQEMINTLNLTDAQKEQMKKNNEEMRPKMEALRDNTTLTPDEKRTQMKALRDEQKAKMDALLTPDQKVKWEEMRKKRMEERKKPDLGSVDPKTMDNAHANEPQ
jgi:Spy/CpxP family protein refolding chaperone